MPRGCSWLERFEKNYENKMGFVGGNGNIEHPDYYTVYGNLTQSLKEIEEAKAIKKAKDEFDKKSELATAPTSEVQIVVDSEEI